MEIAIEDTKRWLTVADVARLRGVSPSAIYKWIRRTPGLPVKRNGRRILIEFEKSTSIPATSSNSPEQPAQTDDPPAEIATPTDITPSTDHTESKLPVGTRPVPVQNPCCGQRELRPSQTSRYGFGFAIFSVPQFLG